MRVNIAESKAREHNGLWYHISGPSFPGMMWSVSIYDGPTMIYGMRHDTYMSAIMDYRDNTPRHN